MLAAIPIPMPAPLPIVGMVGHSWPWQRPGRCWTTAYRRCLSISKTFWDSWRRKRKNVTPFLTVGKTEVRQGEARPFDRSPESWCLMARGGDGGASLVSRKHTWWQSQPGVWPGCPVERANPTGPRDPDSACRHYFHPSIPGLQPPVEQAGCM